MYYKERYKGFSPWGGIQHSSVIARGLKAVSTAGHGGYMVTQKFADKYLSNACKKRALEYSNYLCYEEDCDYAILAYDLLDTFGEKMKSEKITLEEYKTSLLESLSYYNPEYLMEIGVKPLEKQYNLYLERKKEEKMRADKHPDLIISALSVDKETVKVWTADNNIHFVSKESYRDLRKNSKLLLLSKCNEVEYREVI